MTVSQTDFRQALLDPALAVPEGLLDPVGRQAGKRFDVYRNNVVVSLTNALAEAFPVIRKLLGENNFGILAGHFVRAHPPASPLIAYYGAELPDFLEEFEPVQSLGYLPDVARLELGLRASYHAADSVAIEPAALQEIPGEVLPDCKLALSPAVQLLRSRWPIGAIWHFNMTEGAPQPQMAAEDVLITRPEFDPQIVILPAGGAEFVAALSAGETFGTALDRAVAAADDFDLATTLGALLGGGAITDILKET